MAALLLVFPCLDDRLLEELLRLLLVVAEALTFASDDVTFFDQPLFLLLQGCFLLLNLLDLGKLYIHLLNLRAEVECQHLAAFIFHPELPDQITHCLNLDVCHVPLFRHLCLGDLDAI